MSNEEIRVPNVKIYEDKDLLNANERSYPYGLDPVFKFFFSPYTSLFTHISFGVGIKEEFHHILDQNKVRIIVSKKTIISNFLGLLQSDAEALNVLKNLIGEIDINQLVIEYTDLLMNLTENPGYDLIENQILLLNKISVFFETYPQYIVAIWGSFLSSTVLHELNHARLMSIYSYKDKTKSITERELGIAFVQAVGFDKAHFNTILAKFDAGEEPSSNEVLFLQIVNHSMFKILIRDWNSKEEKRNYLYSSYIGSLQELFNYMQWAKLNVNLSLEERRVSLFSKLIAYINKLMFLYPDLDIIREYISLSKSLDTAEIDKFLLKMVNLMNKNSFDRFIDKHFSWIERSTY